MPTGDIKGYVEIFFIKNAAIMERRKPANGSAVRMAQLILLLSKSWRPVSVTRICEYFDISLRTAQRYRKALNESLIAAGGGEFLRVVREGGVERWYLADQEDIMTATFFTLRPFDLNDVNERLKHYLSEHNVDDASNLLDLLE